MSDAPLPADEDDTSAQFRCQQLLCKLVRCMDRGEAPTVEHFLTPGATWVRQHETIRGAQDIAAAVRRRPAGRVVRHTLCNIVVTLSSANTAVAEAYYVAYTCESTDTKRGPQAVVARLGDFHADFLKLGSEWRVSSLHALRLFEYAVTVKA